MVMDDTARGFVEGVGWCFRDVSDPRVLGRCDHSLVDILAIAILAVTCGADDWTDLELFGRAREAWLRPFLELRHGIPSHDTFRRVFGLLDPRQFAPALFQWTKALHEATGGRLIHIDGKALRRSFRKRSGMAMLHLVTAWASQNGLTLGQVACEEKSNEITAIPELLKLLSLKGCTVTLDAMGCQKDIAAQIRKQEGHYVLALKGNQSGLAEDMQALFEAGTQNEFEGMKHDVQMTEETGHGRTEERAVHVIEVPREHPRRREWNDLNTLAVVVTRRVVDDQEQWESRLYVSSHRPRANQLAEAIRRHWSIENGQHWVLDVAFGEDARRQQDRRGATNLAAVRRLVVSLLRQDTATRHGAKAKRLKAALDPNYLLGIFKNAKFDA
jgi:predicted transposase YbfD/YdcC